ncbi:MAG: M23 family metallopeptidase [Sulfuricellaceae bacterium]|nr:M23 family metallopeptidase [Sulfuricellaceae bacterium]
MNIILVSDRLANPKTVALGTRQLSLLLAAWLITPVILAAALFYLALHHAADIDSPYIKSLVLSAQQDQLEKGHAYLQTNLSTMAVRVGQMQAQVLRLEALGDRLANMAGISKQEFQFDKPPARGGAVSSIPSRDLKRSELEKMIGDLSHQLDNQGDQLSVMEAVLMQKSLSKAALPTSRPVETGWYSSNFGWRVDPFTGKNAFHEGVDFMSEVGTPIYAAAGGVVTHAGPSTGYGNLVEIDHGNGLVTRYGHISKVLTKEGDVVLRGQEIAEVGNTGRSTGPHLHFEVRYNGVPQNPARYLGMNG